MTTRRESILSYVKTQIDGVTAVSGRVYRSRVAALRREESPSIVIEPVNDTAVQDVLGFLTWTLQFRVAVVVRGDVPDQQGDSIVESIHALLMADRNMGGLAQDLLPQGTYFSMVEGDKPIGVIETLYNATYRTTETSLD